MELSFTLPDLASYHKRSKEMSDARACKPAHQGEVSKATRCTVWTFMTIFFLRSHSLYITPAVSHVSERQIVLHGSRAIRRDVGVVPRVCRMFGRCRRPSAWRTALSGRRAALTVNSFPKIHVHVAAVLQSRSSLAASSAAFVRCCQRFCQWSAAPAGGVRKRCPTVLFSSATTAATTVFLVVVAVVARTPQLVHGSRSFADCLWQRLCFLAVSWGTGRAPQLWDTPLFCKSNACCFN